MLSRIAAMLASVHLVAAIAIPSAPSLAWDYPGHRIVGTIADLVLAEHYPAAQARVSDLLARKDSAGNIVETRTLSQVSVFPDCARPNSVPFCGRPPSDEENAYAARNKQHARYHYADLPLEQSRYVPHSAGTDDIDVVQMIEYIVLQLSGREPPAKPGVDLTDTEALFLLAHLVADIHQPMHVAVPYFDATCTRRVDPNAFGRPPRFGIGTAFTGTMGGNRIRLVAPAPAVPPAKNLHLYWDIAPVVHAMQAAGTGGSEYEFARLLAAAPPEGWQTAGPVNTWAVQWAGEMLPLAVEAHERLQIRKSAMPTPLAGQLDCSWETSVSPTYEEWARDQARVQLAKAGFRLAALLHEIYAP